MQIIIKFEIGALSHWLSFLARIIPGKKNWNITELRPAHPVISHSDNLLLETGVSVHQTEVLADWVACYAQRREPDSYDGAKWKTDKPGHFE